MAATPVAKPTPYFGPANTKILLFATAITDQTTGVPTRAELNAAPDLTPALGGPGLEGGEFSANSQDVQYWDTLNPGKVANYNTLSDLTLTLTADQAGADQRAAFAQGATVNMGRLETGDTPTRKMSTFFATVASKTPVITNSGNAQYRIGLIATKVFNDVTIPS